MVEWLRRTIEGDKAAAEAATPGPWEAVVDDHGRGEVDASVWSDDLGYYITEKVSSGDRHREDGAHIATHDPRDTISRCEAELALLDLYAEVQHMDYEDTEPEYACGRAVGLGEAVRLLTSGYRHRDGWKDEREVEGDDGR